MNKKGKDMNKKILELLYRSFDSNLDEKEQKQLAEALKNSEELRKEKEQILAQRRTVSDSAERSFKPFFAERLMNRIDSIFEKNGLEIFYETLKSVFRRFAIVSSVIMIVLISYNLATRDSLSSEEIFYASDVTFEEILDLPLF